MRKLYMILSGVAALHLILLMVFVTGGCTGQKVLQNRPFIPAPTPASPPEMEPLLVPENTPAVEQEIVIETKPVETKPAVVDIPPFEGAKESTIKYVVKKNDSLWKIARAYGVSTRELAVYNNLSMKKYLKVGQVINIPPGGEAIPKDKLPPITKVKRSTAKRKKSAPARKRTAREPLPDDGVYVVKSGDSLWKIAIKFNLKTSTLAEANNINVKKALQPGDKLIIPGGKTVDLGQDEPDSPVENEPVEDEPVEEVVESTEVVEEAEVKKAPEDKSEVETDVIEDTSTDISDSVIEEITKSAPETDDSKIEKEAKEMLEEKTEKSDSSATPPSAHKEHEVLSGDTIESIAQEYNVKAEDIRNLNPALPSTGTLKEGIVIKIP